MDNSFKVIKSITCLILIIIPKILSYGFDSANSCSQKAARNGRAQLLQSIPCDLSRQIYCNLPGSSYPWHAVRRFVHENQGLMKRMYGDIRHISVLRDEIQNNEIDVNDIEQAAVRYSRDAFKKTKYLQSDYQNIRTNDILTEPHFRPISTTIRSDIINKTTDEIVDKKLLNEMNKTIDLNFKDDYNYESNHIIDTNISFKENLKKIDSNNLNNQNKSEPIMLSTTLKVVQQIIKSEIDIENNTTKPFEEDVVTVKSQINQTDEILISSSNQENNKNQTKKISNENIDLNGNNKIDIDKDINVKNKLNKTNSATTEGQLFQDVVQKENPIFNNRGVNACPVKEEVVAPFWANNTRGEVLALLNLYPFEQYVHWEKCTNEYKQMYCRDGCRCEQQYRLHRLLAYDPHNECRGIFSDWFRFPSCCICKCYDIPNELRLTSRSPRTSLNENNNNNNNIIKQKIDLAEDEINSANYEFVANEWYRKYSDSNLYN